MLPQGAHFDVFCVFEYDAHRRHSCSFPSPSHAPQVGPGSVFGAGATSEAVSQITAIKASQVEVMSIRLKDLMTLVPPSVLKPVADAAVTENQFVRQRIAALASSKNSVGALAQDGES